MIRILIADDHQVLIDGLSAMISDVPDCTIAGQALNGKEVLQQLKSRRYDLVLLDINMPEMDGIDACKLIKQRYPEVKVLALTMYNEPSFIRGMLDNGADGYILKNTGKEELLEAIYHVYQGGKFFTKASMQQMVQGEASQELIGLSSRKPRITRREKDILRLILEQMTTQEIADKLFISPTTVETHRKNLMQKLQVRNMAGLVKFAVETRLLDR